MKNVNLSYIITTRNRLPFLKITLKKLLAELLPDEEVVVVDGNSADGSKAYLQQLFDEGQIHQFISEPDQNQAHGWNKGMLMAKGAIIKKIIDDDVHDLTAIRKCRDYMNSNPGIAICISNVLESSLDKPGAIHIATRLPYFMKWKAGSVKAFTFSDVSMLLRKSAISRLGLYDTQFKMIDWEYALRASYLQLGIAYYTGYNSMAIATPGNVTSTASKQLLLFEGRIGKIKYGYPGDSAEISLYSHFKIWAGKSLHNFLNRNNPAPDTVAVPPAARLEQIYSAYYEQIAFYNTNGQFDFIS